ncbi:type IV pilus twitching motility protein PilT [Elusimicrobiota bacterium]
MELKDFFQAIISSDVSDIHFKVGAPPVLRAKGKIIRTKVSPLNRKTVEELISRLMDDDQKQRFAKDGELDFSTTLESVGRFRINAFRERSNPAMSIRVVPTVAKTPEDLNLPAKQIAALAKEKRGLILFSGITGAGKTTTLNSFIRYINENLDKRIVTIEDPIEFYHQDSKSTICQREVGIDTASYAKALKYVLRQDPDVIVIGEIRDRETMESALLAAESGHLVCSTIHTIDAVKAVLRIIDMFAREDHERARNTFASVLKAVITQRLVPSADGSIIPATEILLGTVSTRRAIQMGKIDDLYRAMAEGEYYGMHTFDQNLVSLFKSKKISKDIAMEFATNPEDLKVKLL